MEEEISPPWPPPMPLAALLEAPIPPFLSKTFDFVDDPSSDLIISWGITGGSFVVWDDVEFSRTILPMNFKHSNFSSFVRQLNTYGFRKIDAEKWEFANEGFMRGRRYLLKTIQRRKTSPRESCNEMSSRHALEFEIEHMKRERSSMMTEVSKLHDNHHAAAQHAENVFERLKSAEQKHEQIVSSLRQMLHNPEFSARLRDAKHQSSNSIPRTTRKFLKHFHRVDSSESDQHGPLALEKHCSCNAGVPFEIEDISPDELKLMQGFLAAAEAGPSGNTIDHTLKEMMDGP